MFPAKLSILTGLIICCLLFVAILCKDEDAIRCYICQAFENDTDSNKCYDGEINKMSPEQLNTYIRYCMDYKYDCALLKGTTSDGVRFYRRHCLYQYYADNRKHTHPYNKWWKDGKGDLNKICHEHHCNGPAVEYLGGVQNRKICVLILLLPLVLDYIF